MKEVIDDQPIQVDETSCSGKLHPQAIIGLELFNARQFFEAHEALESAWKAESGPVRELYRGVLQVAVAYLHIQRGNYTGARKMFTRCKPWLAPFPDQCRGINLGQLKRDFLVVEAMLLRLGPGGITNLDPTLLKPIQWKVNH